MTAFDLKMLFVDPRGEARWYLGQYKRTLRRALGFSALGVLLARRADQRKALREAAAILRSGAESLTC